MSVARPPVFGIPEIDNVLGPVLPAGWLGLVEGSAGTGTHLLAKQAAHAAAGYAPVLYYATHESLDEVTRAFAEFGWDSGPIAIADLGSEYQQEQLDRDIAVGRARAKGLSLKEASLGTTPVVPARYPASLAGRILTDIAPRDSPFRLVLDSIDLLLEQGTAEEAPRVARQIRHQAVAVGGSALLTVHPAVAEERTLALLEVIADFVVHLRLIEDGNQFYPKIALTKVRNHPERTRIFRGSVTARGMEAQF
ncbi:MAG: RAD55 family ATPase [Thermoplasmata archaeon]